MRRLQKLQQYGQRRAEELEISEEAALIFGGKPKRMLERAIEGKSRSRFRIPILEEVRRHLPAKFGWSDERTTEAVESINEYAVHVTPSEQIDAVPTGPDDNRVLECAVEAASDVIVSGDRDLLRIGSMIGVRTFPGSV